MGAQFYSIFFGFIVFSVSMIEGSPEESCLDCLLYAASGCDCTKGYCANDVCGPYRITKPYWIDGGEINGDYVQCTTDYKCSRDTVETYLDIYKKDCNGDGVIDCFDYGAIHNLGPRGCLNTDNYSSEFFTKLNACTNNNYLGCKCTDVTSFLNK